MPELEIRHLRMLCAIADTGSLTRAAARLGLSQPGLSTQLQRIERMVGTAVFERSRFGVQPTAYGRVLVDAARGVLAGVDHLQAMTRHPGEQVNTVLRMGGVQGRLVTAWIRLLDEQLTGREVRAYIGLPSPTLVKMLGDGQLDAITVYEFPGYELNWPDGVVHRVLQPREPTYVILSESHPLAAKDEFSLVDLADEQWILRTPDPEGLQAVFLSACIAAGFNPKVRHYVDDPVARQHLVQTGQGIATCRATSREGNGVVIRPLAGDQLPIRRFIAWRDNVTTSCAGVLCRTAVQAYLALVDNNPAYARWWSMHPEVHPNIDDC